MYHNSARLSRGPGHEGKPKAFCDILCNNSSPFTTTILQKKILKAFKKNFSCNGAIVKDKDEGEVLQLSGDQRTNINEFLCSMEICTPGQIVLHGF